MYEGYLIDLDGTMYRGKERIEEAVTFVKALKAKGVPYLFVTNNSSSTREQVAERLERFDVPASAEQVFNSSMATAEYIDKDKRGASVYMIGEKGLQESLMQKGIKLVHENPDYVVMGIDRGLTYEKLANACLAVRNGATLLSTNKDVAFPSERGFVPGNGALTAVVSVSTGVKPIFIGKPEPIIMELAMEKLGVAKEKTVMVGDNYHTDILAGMNAGLDTLLVYTGVTAESDLSNLERQPTHTIESLDQWKI
ncbi:TIGR01457 family HAD-type hydrolase [Alkalihalobacillus sp. AL-G]|uniref:TIGR01457 family HAD-type hydrolase n=1 Tax=Alkalihalobacillus sp. AL-G TaxID=2926399 RepID=UPI00272D71F5|nr:TIGR01457 family HAD-type hydrolase [Alkalihalobacillus sp. AL-G]WLD95457.1 TIGR01457 family HAD-type hydrolase [Alkalihalobacillus sp. AL-G]